MHLFQGKYTASAAIVLAVISGCASNSDTSSSAGSSVTVSGSRKTQGDNIANLPNVANKRLSIEDDLPVKPASGRAFLGVRVADCVNASLGSGAYVIGYFEYDGKSPSRTAGIEIGDKILSINNRYGINESNFTTYIQQVAKTAGYTVKVQRKIGGTSVVRDFTVLSFGLPESCISSERSEPCLKKPGLDRRDACNKLP